MHAHNLKVAGYIISATVYEDTEAHRLPGEVDMQPPDSYCSSDQQTEQMKNLKSFLADVEKRGDLFNRLRYIRVYIHFTLANVKRQINYLKINLSKMAVTNLLDKAVCPRLL